MGHAMCNNPPTGVMLLITFALIWTGSMVIHAQMDQKLYMPVHLRLHWKPLGQ